MSILSKVTAFTKRFHHAGGDKHLEPARDWLVLLGVLFVALLASLAWNAWFFFVALDEESAGPAVSEEQKLDTSAIEKARVLFDARALEEERYRSEYHFNDPSK